jgi:hypothetical protein
MRIWAGVIIVAISMSALSATHADDYVHLADRTKICIKGVIDEMRNYPGKSSVDRVGPVEYGNDTIVTRCYETYFAIEAAGFNTRMNPDISKQLFDILWRDALMEVLLEPGKLK